MPVRRLTDDDDLFTVTDPTIGPWLIFGRNGNDTIAGSTSDDEIHGGRGNDIIAGGGGDDLLFGGDGNDTIYATGPATLQLVPFTGFVYAEGGNGNDHLVAGFSGI